MSQALHIFKKDVLHLRFEISISITVAGLFAFIETKHALWPVDLVNSRTPASYLALLLLPVAWWMLIGRVVHDEALPGDRQFWITRPYSWRSLLSAKLLFILAFVNLPIFIAQAVIVHAYGFSLAAELVGLLWSQVLLTIVFVLPILAMSALTDGFVQLIAGILTPCVIALALAGLNYSFKLQYIFVGVAGGLSNGHEWIRAYLIFLIITVAASAILFWQYSRRRTIVARSFAAAAWVLVGMLVYFISWSPATRIDYALSRKQTDLSSIRLLSDLSTVKPHIGFRQGGEYVSVNVPFQIFGLPSGTHTRIENLSESFQVPDGTTWKSDDGFSWENPDPPEKQFFVQSAFYGGNYLTRNDVPVTVHGTLYLAVFGDPHTTQVPIGEGSVTVPGVGLCSANEAADSLKYFVICNSAFRSPTVLVSYHFVQANGETSKDFDPKGQMSFSPFPAELRISPVSQDFRQSWVSTPWDHAIVETLKPIGHVRLDFDIDLGKATIHRSNSNEKIRSSN